MMGVELLLPQNEEGFSYELVKVGEAKGYESNYFQKGETTYLISSATQEHLNIAYVVVQTDTYHKELVQLQLRVSTIMVIVFLLIVVISWLLSLLFMRPIREKVTQIERFIQDISHELNTPITALSMSSKRALQKKVYDEKILTNISISTKQLYSIYKSLAYLSFTSPKQELQEICLRDVLLQSIEYYKELLSAKNIEVQTNIGEAKLWALESRVELLFSNLLSNAIKYSMPNTTIKLTLKEGFFSIEDQGIGIEQSKIENIFKPYERNSNIAGGFGVGLSIVKQICEEYKIAIQVTSKTDVGSCFTLRW